MTEYPKFIAADKVYGTYEKHVPAPYLRKSYNFDKKAEKAEKAGKVDISSIASPGKDGRNSNERILELHKAGKSNMAIAKELGLGIGEVKLVIDLFEGI